MKRIVWSFTFFLLLISFFMAMYWYPKIVQSRKELLLVAHINQAKVLDAQMHQIQITRRQREPIRIPVLMYHYIEIVTDLNDTLRMSQNIPPQIFESQIVTLLKYGYTPIFMSDLINYFSGVSDLPAKPIILTFDDGYADFYTDAFPILKKYQVKGVSYVVSGFVGKDKNYLNYKQLLEIAASPLVEIGAHSVSHQDLPYLSYTQMQNEISNSKVQIESMIKKPVSNFAYPYGSYSKDATDLVKQAGFDSAVTTDEGVVHTYESRYLMKRIRPGRLTDSAFIERIQ